MVDTPFRDRRGKNEKKFEKKNEGGELQKLQQPRESLTLIQYFHGSRKITLGFNQDPWKYHQDLEERRHLDVGDAT